MENHELLTSQKNLLFESIREVGFNPAEFHWESGQSKKYRIIVSTLAHSNTGYYYVFDHSTHHMEAEYSPGEHLRVDRTELESWSQQRETFLRWLQYLKRELESPDLWAAVSEEARLLEAASSEEDNSPFSADEKAYIISGIKEIKQYLLTAHKLDPELVEARLNYLAEASDRLGRKDWKNLLLSTIVSIIVTASLPSDTIREIFRFIGTVLRAILVTRFLTP